MKNCLLCLAAAIILCVPPAAATSPPAEDDYVKATERVVLEILAGVAQEDYDHLLLQLDTRTSETLEKLVVDRFGSANRFTDFLSEARHPARFRRAVRAGQPTLVDDEVYVKVVLTGDYYYRDGRQPPRVENKPVELWVRITKINGIYVIGLDYPIHDLLYLLQ